MNFKCVSCGVCCKDFGELGTLPLFDDEKKRFEKLGKEMNIDVEFVPENVMMDEYTGAMFSGNWGMKGNPCPFLDKKNNKCKIYQDRALICKAFPINKIPKTKEDLNLGCFIKCKHFDSKNFITLNESFEKFFGIDSTDSRKNIDERQKLFSEKIFGLISLDKIKLRKVENPYKPDVIPIEEFFKIAGI